MNTRLWALPVLLVLGGCASAPAPVTPPPQSPIAYSYSSGPSVVGRYQGQPAALPEPIRAPGAVLPGQGLYGTDAGIQGMAEGNADQAELDFEKALDVNPFDPAALNNLAVAKAEQGQFHQATALLERAAKLQPDNADVAANLARLRGFVQGYAMAGVDPAKPKPSAGPLPPAPPPLWGSMASASRSYASVTSAPVGEASMTPPTADSSYYRSEACKRKTTGSGKNTRVEIECEPRP